MANSILSHLTFRFASHPENVATEALAYILEASSTSRRALMALVGQFCSETGSAELLFETQVTGEDGSRPDLVGRDTLGKIRLLLEAKFWAGLTDAQPIQYLEALPRPGLLLFVAPEKRLDLLWAELKSRIREAGLYADAIETELLRSLRLDQRTTAVVSWRVLLDTMHAATENAGELSASADIRQLAALCDRMDADTFLPLTNDELNPAIGRRVVQFSELASRLTDALVGEGRATVRGLKATATLGRSGRYLYFGPCGAFLGFDAHAWAKWGETPVWLSLKRATVPWTADPTIATSMQAAGLPFRSDANGTHVPIRLNAGVELDGLIREGLHQLRRVGDALTTLGSS